MTWRETQKYNAEMSREERYVWDDVLRDRKLPGSGEPVPTIGDFHFKENWLNESDPLQEYLLLLLDVLRYDSTKESTARALAIHIKAQPQELLDAMAKAEVLGCKYHSPYDGHPTAYSYYVPKHVHEPVPQSIHANNMLMAEITLQCATCKEWLPSIKKHLPVQLPIEVPNV